MGNPVVQGKYELLRPLGKGGMAEVFLAKQIGLRGFEKLIVLKRILPDRAMDGDFVTMFLDEARTVADLRHPNVINVFEINRADGTYFMAMEFLHGHDVRDLLKKANKERAWIPLGQTAEIVLGAAAGLFHAHTKTSIDGAPLGIIHRDVSPPNLIVGFNGEVKVVDFGIAKVANRSQQTEAGALKGKYAYMSPEQAQGRTLDGRSDQFALGVVFWEMLTQRRLFKRKNGTQTLMAVIEDEVPAVRQFRADIPAAVDAVLQRMLNKNPERRYATCDELRGELEEMMAAEGIAHSASRLGKYLKELFGKPETEAELGKPQLEPDDVADLSEQFRAELIEHSGRAPSPTPKPRKEKGASTPSRATKKDRPKKEASGKAAENETVVDRKESASRSGTSSKSAAKASSPKASPSRETKSQPTRPTDMQAKVPAAMGLDDDKTLILKDGGQEGVLLPVSQAPSTHQGSNKTSSRRALLIAGGLAAGLALALGGGLAGWMLARPKEATVIVRTTPKGARVIVDGKDTGEVTPHILRPRIGATLKVRVEKDGFAAATSVVRVSTGAPYEVDLELERR